MRTFINTAIIRVLAAIGSLKARLTEERGQDLMEYAVLTGLIAVVAAGALAGLAATGAFSNMATAIGNCVDFTANPYSCP